jgi:AraC-like DNA-binding protein
VEFILVLEGAVTLEMNGERRRLCPGDGALIFPHVPHCYYLEDAPCERFMAVFDPQYFGEFRDLFLYSKPKSPMFTAAQTAALPLPDRRELASMCSLWPPVSSLDKADRCARFAVLLGKFLRLCEVTEEKSDEALYRAATSYCAEHFHDHSLSVEKVACALGISRSKLSTLFSEKHGGLKAYINLCRLRHAELLLRNGNMSIAQVAEEAGFSEVRTFNRLFKQKNGKSPLVYRKQ